MWIPENAYHWSLDHISKILFKYMYVASNIGPRTSWNNFKFQLTKTLSICTYTLLSLLRIMTSSRRSRGLNVSFVSIFGRSLRKLRPTIWAKVLFHLVLKFSEKSLFRLGAFSNKPSKNKFINNVIQYVKYVKKKNYL